MNQFSRPGGMGGQVWSAWLWFSPSGSLVPFNINRHPMGPTVWEQSLVALCPTSCEVLEIYDNLFGLVYSYWTTESWLRKTSAMLIVFSWYICPAGREGPWLSLCSLTCSFSSLIAAPMEAGWLWGWGHCSALLLQWSIVWSHHRKDNDICIGIVPRIYFDLPNQRTMLTVKPEDTIYPSGTIMVCILPFCIKAFKI